MAHIYVLTIYGENPARDQYFNSFEAAQNYVREAIIKTNGFMATTEYEKDIHWKIETTGPDRTSNTKYSLMRKCIWT